MLQTTKFKQAFHRPYKDSKSLKKQAKQTNKKTLLQLKKGREIYSYGKKWSIFKFYLSKSIVILIGRDDILNFVN